MPGIVKEKDPALPIPSDDDPGCVGAALVGLRYVVKLETVFGTDTVVVGKLEMVPGGLTVPEPDGTVSTGPVL